MRIDGHSAASALPNGSTELGRKARSTEDAARQFEEVLVREFVRTMTKDLFKGGLAGDDSAGWVKAQGDAQTDALTDAVTRHLVDSGQMGIADLLMQNWQGEGAGGDLLPGTALPLDPDRDLTTQRVLDLRRALFNEDANQ